MRFKEENVENPATDLVLGQVYEGRGSIAPMDSEQEFECSFRVWQTIHGNIEGVMAEFDEEKHPEISRLVQTSNDISFRGSTEQKATLVSDRAYVAGHSWGSGSYGMDILIRIDMIRLEITHPSVHLDRMCGVATEILMMNLDLRRVLRGSSDLSFGKLRFAKLKNHKETLRRSKLGQITIATGAATIINRDLTESDFNNYLEALREFIPRLCMIISMAKSTFIDYCAERVYIYQGENEDAQLYKELLSHPKKKTPSYGMELIEDRADFYDFVEFCANQYSNDLNEKYYLDIAVEWYLEGAGESLAQKGFLLLCVFLETLKHRHNLIKRRTEILPGDNFEIFQEGLQGRARELLHDLGYSGEDTHSKRIRGSIYANLKGINRWSFSEGLAGLLEDLSLSYDDIVPDLGQISKLRNQIVHTGIQKEDHRELLEALRSSKALSQRVILGLLGYKGHFLDSTDEFKRKDFKDFVTDS